VGCCCSTPAGRQTSRYVIKDAIKEYDSDYKSSLCGVSPGIGAGDCMLLPRSLYWRLDGEPQARMHSVTRIRVFISKTTDAVAKNGVLVPR
jgi:hypothetical protein